MKEKKIPGGNSLKLAHELKEFECQNITYMSEDFPVFWEKAKGTYIYDVDGNEYLDFNSAFGVCALGHCNPAIIKAVKEQTEKLIHGMGDVHPPKIKAEFLRELSSILPEGYGKAILSCNGSDAIESAIKTVQLCTKKPGLIAFKNSYHGLNHGSLDATYNDFFRNNFSKRLANLTFFADYPAYENELGKSLEQVKNIIKEKKEILGGIILEPIQGRGGVLVPPNGFLKNLSELCKENNLLLIFDEIYTGLGRTGKLFAFEHEGIKPDLLCLGKILGGGLPLSVCVGKKEIMDSWPPSVSEAIHTSTFLGNPLACAAGLATLKELKSKNYIEHVAKLGEYTKSLLKETLLPSSEKNSKVKDIRGRGLMIGVELTDEPRFSGKIIKQALKERLILLPSGPKGNVLLISPPFVIEQSEINRGIGILKDLIERA